MKSKLIINLFIIVLVFSFGIYHFQKTLAQGPTQNPIVNVLGWMWGATTDDSLGTGIELDKGTGLGWISGTNQNVPDALNYGLTIPQADGDITGQAWSSNVGWIDFQPGGTPPDAIPAGVRRAGNNLVGWARVKSIADAIGPPDNAGGWDGWIKFHHGQPKEVTINAFQQPIPPNVPAGYTHYLSGYAWSENMGWIYFGGTDAAIYTPGTAPQNDNPPFIVINFGPQLTASCSGFPNPAQLSGTPLSVNVNWTGQASGGSGNYTFTWDFTNGPPPTHGNPSSGTGSSITTNYTPPPGTRTANLTVNDGINSITTSCFVDVQNPGNNPTVSCSGAANSSSGTQTTVTWTAVSNNAGNPSFSWTFPAPIPPDPPIPPQSGTTAFANYASVGTKSATVVMTANNVPPPGINAVCQINITNNKEPLWKEIIPFL